LAWEKAVNVYFESIESCRSAGLDIPPSNPPNSSEDLSTGLSPPEPSRKVAKAQGNL